MSCPEQCKSMPGRGRGYIIIIVLYILLAIILGTTMCY